MGGWCVALLMVVGNAGALRAQQAPAASSPAALKQYREAVTIYNGRLYDLAVDEWEKFLKLHGSDPLAPKAQFYLGISKLQLKKYDEAAAAFNAVISKYPQFELLENTYLNLGLAQFNAAQDGKPEQFDEAAKSFSTLVTKYPQSKNAPQALFYMGEAQFARGKKEEAAKSYGQLIAKYPNDPLRPDALFALGATQEELGKPAEAGATYDIFIKEFKDHPVRAEVVLHRGETLFAQKQFGAAAGWFSSAAASKNFELADYATLRQAESLAEDKKHAEAAALYASIPEKFPKSNHRADAIVAAGNCYYLSGDLPQAIKWLGQVVEAGGESAPEAAHWMARALLKEKKTDEALKAVESVLDKADKSPFLPNLLMDQADATFDSESRRAEAAPLYAAIAEKHSDSKVAPQALYMAGFAALQQSDYAKARDYSQSFLKKYPGDELNVDVKCVAADAAMMLNEPAEAAKLYQDLLKNSSGRPDAPVWRVRNGLALFLDKKYAEVVSSLEPAVGSLKDADLLAEAQFLIGSAQLELQQPEAAAKALSASLKAQPKWRQADETLLYLAAANRSLNKLPEATAQARKVLTDFPDSKSHDRAHLRLGEYAYAAGDFPGAITEYQAIIKDWPKSTLVPHAVSGMGWAQLGAKDYSAAAATMTTLIDKHSDQASLVPYAYRARGIARQELADFQNAIDDLNKFLDSNPPAAEKSHAQYISGLAQYGLKKYDKAAETFRAILVTDPKYASIDNVLYDLAWALKEGGKDTESTATFERLAKDHPESSHAAEALFHIGEAQFLAKDYKAASKSFYDAMNKAGKSDIGEKAAYQLALTHYQLDQFDKAQQGFEYQLATYPQGELAADAQFMLAESWFKQNKYDVALANYQKFLAKPSSRNDFLVLAQLHAGQSAAQLGKWDESLKLLDQAQKNGSESQVALEIAYERGWAKQNLGQLDDAFKLYNEVADKTDREIGARARFMMGEIQFEKKEYAEAVRNFYKVAFGYGATTPEPFHKWQANAAYEAGRCFEVMRRTDEAKKSYKEVVDRFPNSDKAELAKKRLAELGN